MQLRPPQPALPALALLALLSPAVAAVASPAAAAGGFKIEVDRPGIYRVTYGDLVAGGLEAAFLRSSSLTLTRDGEPVPLWIEDGGDGRLGRGDWLELAAWESPTRKPQQAPGEATFLLRLAAEPGARMRAEPPAPTGRLPRPGEPVTLSRVRREEDRLFLRFPDESPETSEVWYWERLTPLDEPLEVAVSLPGLVRDAHLPIRFRLRLRGWSHLPRWLPGRPQPPADLPDHRLEVRFGGRALGVAEWSNRSDGYLWESPPIPAHRLPDAGEPFTLRLAVSPRTLGADPLVDVAMLDWVEVVYPRRTTPLDVQALFLSPDSGATGLPRLPLADGTTLYRRDGSRVAGGALGHPLGPGAPGAASAWSEPGMWAVPAGGLLAPRSVRRLRADGLRDPGRQADYLMIVHPSLRGSSAPLASAHRRRGLSVQEVDLRAVYDEFGHGVAGPHAIRDFLRWAHANWRRPAPRYVLLIGDASWDTRNRIARPFSYADRPYSTGRGATLGSHRAPRYETGSHRNHRNLVPTGSTATFEGHAASDAWLADVDGDDLPDLAIGRLPAADRREARAMVAKTLRYLEAPRVGPWRREMLFISDGNRVIDGTSVRVSQALAADGFMPVRVRPEEGDPSPEARRERLVAALDRGPLLVHFFGHGGRNIWRTGGSGGAADRDLFTLDDLDRLTPRDQLPIVLSMSCYSAPFDHPNADSIGEKFFRLPDRGAVAVIAASWRNTPAERWSRLLTAELTLGGSVGDALLRAKQRSKDREFVGQYNLLGDPALPLQLPGPLEVRQALSRRERLPMVVAELPPKTGGSFAGRAVIDWLDRSGEPLQRQEIAVDGPGVEALFPGPAEQVADLGTALVYLWDAAAGRDALGGTPVRPPRNGRERGRVRVARGKDRGDSEVRR